MLYSLYQQQQALFTSLIISFASEPNPDFDHLLRVNINTIIFTVI